MPVQELKEAAGKLLSGAPDLRHCLLLMVNYAVWMY